MENEELNAAFDNLNRILRDAGFMTREEVRKARNKRVLKAAAIITITSAAAFAASYVYHSKKNTTTED